MWAFLYYPILDWCTHENLIVRFPESKQSKPTLPPQYIQFWYSKKYCKTPASGDISITHLTNDFPRLISPSFSWKSYPSLPPHHSYRWFGFAYIFIMHTWIYCQVWDSFSYILRGAMYIFLPLYGRWRHRRRLHQRNDCHYTNKERGNCHVQTFNSELVLIGRCNRYASIILLRWKTLGFV